MDSGNMELLKTPLYDLHIEKGGKMVGFAGYAMPVQYAGAGIIKEHLHVRAKAGLFDVSHMGQINISAVDSDPALFLEKIIPSDLQSLKHGDMRYSVILNDEGGVVDDLILTRMSDSKFFAVINAACKESDIEYLNEQIGADVKIKLLEDRGQLALHGPISEEILLKFIPEIKALKFMKFGVFEYSGAEGYVTRSGYTGEDGFEVSLPNQVLEKFTRELLEDERVALIGLGARDSLRLEAGLPLYGHELGETITPIEAGLKWIIQKIRRERANFIGSDVILEQIENGVKSKRVALAPTGKAPVREGTPLINEDEDNIGMVTSGTYSPTLAKPIAMGYASVEHIKSGKKIYALLRGRKVECELVKLPFVEHKYKR